MTNQNKRGIDHNPTKLRDYDHVMEKKRDKPQKFREAGGLSSCRGKVATRVLFDELNPCNEVASLKYNTIRYQKNANFTYSFVV